MAKYYGTITGTTGNPGTVGKNGYRGGVGLGDYAGALINYGKITGGTGGMGGGVSIQNLAFFTLSVEGNGGTGGVGVSVGAGCAFINDSLVYGGLGGNSQGVIAQEGGAGGAGGAGVYLASGATAINNGHLTGGVGGTGSNAGNNGGGGQGALLNGASSLTNNGTILGGVGGYGGTGVQISGAGGYLDNLALVSGNISTSVGLQGPGAGVSLGTHTSGTIVNGSVAAVATITGGTGVFAGYQTNLALTNHGLINGTQSYGVKSYATASSTVTNFGTISGKTTGIFLRGGTSLVENYGTISGEFFGVLQNYGSPAGALTLINSGVISGMTDAVKFAGLGSRLEVETGAIFNGAVIGDASATLEMAQSGGVTLTGLGGPGTLSGGVSAMFSGFGAYAIDAAAYVTLVGSNGLASTQSLNDQGTLTNLGTMSQGGSVTLGGVITNAVSATWDIVANTGITGPGTFTNAGLLEETAGTGASTIAADIVNTGVITGGSGTLEFTGPSNSFMGTINGAATVEFGGGISTLGASLDLSVAAVSLMNSGSVMNLTANLVYDGTFTEGAGTKVSLMGNNLTLSGAGSSFAGGVVGPGILAFSGGSETLTGASLKVDAWTISGSAAVSLGANLNFAQAFTLQSSTFTLGTYFLTLTGSTVFTGAEIDGGRLYTKAASSLGGLTLGGGAAWYNYALATQSAATTLGDTVSGAATFINFAAGTIDITTDTGIAVAGSGGRITNQGLLEKTGGTGVSTIAAAIADSGVITAATGTLAFIGPVNKFSGTINGAGTVAFAGGTTTLSVGASLGVAALSLVKSGSRLSLGTSLAYAGVFTGAAGTTLLLGAFTLTLSGTGSSFAGGITGTGTLAFSGGSDTLAGASLAIRHWTISGGAAVSLGANLNYAGAFTQDASDLTLTGNGLDLRGAATFAGGTIDGGRLYTEAAASLAGLTLGGGAVWYNSALATQSAATTLGDAVSGAVTIANQAAGTIDITSDVGIAEAGIGDQIDNQGLLEKAAGTGTSTIGVNVANIGTIAVSSGTLEFAGEVSGVGSAAIAGGTLQFDSEFRENVAFTGTSGVLQLAKSVGFTGTITGFSLTGGTSLDLRDIAFGAKTKATFSGTTTSGTLTVTDGTHTAKITLEGDYTGSTFTASSDNNGGVIIIDPAAQSASASTHAFVAAMSAFAPVAGPGVALGVDPARRTSAIPVLAHGT